MEKVAQVFYNKNYADEDDDLHQSSKESKYNFKIFNKTAKEEIDNNGDYTKVNTENDFHFINYNKKNDNINNNDIKYKTIEIN